MTSYCYNITCSKKGTVNTNTIIALPDNRQHTHSNVNRLLPLEMTTSLDELILNWCQPVPTVRLGRETELQQLGEELTAGRQQSSHTHQ